MHEAELLDVLAEEQELCWIECSFDLLLSTPSVIVLLKFFTVLLSLLDIDLLHVQVVVSLRNHIWHDTRDWETLLLINESLKSVDISPKLSATLLDLWVLHLWWQMEWHLLLPDITKNCTTLFEVKSVELVGSLDHSSELVFL